MYKAVSLVVVLLFVYQTQAQKNSRFVDSIRKSSNIPETAYAVVTKNKILDMGICGMHSILLHDTASMEDRFHIGSNTKAMTAFMIARKVENNELGWDTQFFELFPQWKDSSNKAYANITLKDLLSHRGLIQPFQGENDPEIPRFEGSQQEKRQKFARYVLTLPPAKLDSNHIFEYSNAGYSLAALMLEKVTHRSWEDNVNQVFNKDLGLHVGLSWPENQKDKDTWGHSDENGKLVPVPSNTTYLLDYTEPAGNINIKLRDYVRFIQMNLEGLSGHNNYLQAQTYRFLHDSLPQYAFGWFNIEENGRSWSTHSGTAGTYYSLVQIDKTTGVAFVVLTNSFNQNTVEGVRTIMRRLKKVYDDN